MSKQDIARLKEILAQNSYQLTKARQFTFELLLHDEPQTMRQLLDKAQGSIDRVSVYRNIEVFEKIGIVHRIYIGWKYKLELSDQFVSHHHHLSCMSCGKIIDIEDTHQMDALIKAVGDKFDFQIDHHQLEMEGYCSQCQSTVS